MSLARFPGQDNRQDTDSENILKAKDKGFINVTYKVKGPLDNPISRAALPAASVRVRSTFSETFSFCRKDIEQ
jgi:hypothetical protein